MICPRCASEQSDELKFCKSCGAHLEAVRQVLNTREPPASFDWSKTWVADMFLSQAEQKRRRREIERQIGITPEEKRRTEINAEERAIRCAEQHVEAPYSGYLLCPDTCFVGTIKGP